MTTGIRPMSQGDGGRISRLLRGPNDGARRHAVLIEGLSACSG